MHQVDPPTFENWRHYCFTLGYADFSDRSGDPSGVVKARIERYVRMDEQILTQYLTRLFEEAGTLVGQYTPDQISDATWFIFGCPSQYIPAVRSSAIRTDAQLRCYRSVTTLYLDLYDKLCNRGGLEDDDISNTERLDCAVYMIWDMGGIELSVMFPEDAPHLCDAGLDILETVLAKSRTPTCRLSALYGLGHICNYHPERCEKIITSFLELHGSTLPDWLAHYAEQARDGCVQ